MSYIYWYKNFGLVIAILQTLWTEQENPAEPCHYARAKACIVEYLMLTRTAGSSRLRSDLRFQF